MVHLHYSRCGDVRRGRLNFGDLLTPYLYNAIVGQGDWKPERQDTIYFGSGSIMREAKPTSIIWGSGVMWKTDRFPRPRKILSVRGPITREVCLRLGYQCPEVYGDIGLLMPLFYSPTIPKRFKLGIIPHYIDFKGSRHLASVEGVLYIDILEGVEKVIDNFLQCEFILSSSLHGLIVPHAYGIPAAWVQLSNKIAGDNSKYYDYYHSVGVHTADLLPLKAKDLKGKSVSELVNLVKGYPNPVMPIDTRHIIRACPFGPGPHLKDVWHVMGGET